MHAFTLHSTPHIVFEPGATLDDVLRALIAAGVAIRGCTRREYHLEEAFSRILEAEAGDES